MKIDVLDHGSVELVDSMGGDLRIVNMARQSFGTKAELLMSEKERGLINFLMKNRHGTPFEGVVITLQVKCPIFVAREWMRHRIASYNEFSGRYSKMSSDFYVPSGDQLRSQVGKPGSYSFEPLPDGLAESTRAMIEENNGDALFTYDNFLEQGVAKEVARMVLPVNIYTSFTMVANLRSLFNFVSLRSHKDAMWEIRRYSEEIEKMLWSVAPVAYRAFVDNGRVAP